MREWFVALSPLALREIREAIDWYRERNRAICDRFEAQMVEALARISEAPDQGPVVNRGIRRLLVRRFPYALLYSVEAERVLVLAVMHSRRRPGYWQGCDP